MRCPPRPPAAAAALFLSLGLGFAGSCGDSGKDATKPADKPKSTGQGQASGQQVALASTAVSIVDKIKELESTRDVTCWTSFRQLDNFISQKAYSDFATLTRIIAAKALVQAVWAEASRKAAGADVTVADIEGVFSIEAELDEAKKAELEKFAKDQGWQQFRDYRTTGEHWRVMLSVVQDELSRTQPTIKPLAKDAEDHLAMVTTRLGLSLLTESGQIAIEARTPLIESEHVRQAYKNLLKKHSIPEAPKGSKDVDHAVANEARIPLTGALIEAKIAALRSYNDSGADLQKELNRISKIPLDEGATQRMVGELMSMARFFAKGFEPMRADNYLADGNFAPANLEPKPYITAAHVENVSQQIWPYIMMPNGDVKMRFEPRPGHISPRDLEGQDVLLLDHQMNAVRDTALHWVILQEVWKKDPYAMDPFAAEYLSELVSIVATFYIRRAQTMARGAKAESINAEIMGRVRDVGYVQVMPKTEAEVAAEWGEEQKAAKAKALTGYDGPMFADVTAKWGLPTTLPEDIQGLKPGETSFDIQTVMGSGVAVGDLDGDGFSDVFVAGEGLSRLYLNQAGKGFEDVTDTWMSSVEAAKSPMNDARGVLMVDYDGDADLDLVLLRSRSPSMLLRNDGGSLVDASKETGFTPGLGAHVATAFDYDKDGDLDLYVGYYGSRSCNEQRCQGRNLPSLDGRNGTPNQLYRNDDGKFTEVGEATGTADEGWTLAASSFDYDLDGDFDLYLANDFGANPLMRNNGDGTFTNVAVEVGAADRGSGMNVSFADLDGNGAFDLFVSNIDMFSKNIKIVFPSDESVVDLNDQILRSFEYLSGNKLYFNLEDEGQRRFEAREPEWFEPGDKGWGWAGVFFDYDLDGDEDMYLSNGWIPESPATDQRNQMYLRDGNLFYRMPEGEEFPGSYTGNSRSVVAFDMDNDGDLDLLANNYAQPPRLLENRRAGPGKKNHWLMVRLTGQGKNTAAVGATLELQAGGRTLRRLVTCGEGYLGQQDRRIHFGIADAASGDLTVKWPDGSEKTFKGLAADAVHEISFEPKGS